MRTAMTAAFALTLAAASAQASELAPLQAYQEDFGSGASAQVYYTAERDGHRAVATVQAGEGESATVFRFTATLADGQGMEVSVPRGPGQPAGTLKLTRRGERFEVVEETAKLATAE